MGDDLTHGGHVARAGRVREKGTKKTNSGKKKKTKKLRQRYMPEAMGAAIVGAKNWTTYNVGHANSTGTWWLCKTDSPTHHGDCAWQGLCDLPYMPKFKGLALCA